MSGGQLEREAAASKQTYSCEQRFWGSQHFLGGVKVDIDTNRSQDGERTKSRSQ